MLSKIRGIRSLLSGPYDDARRWAADESPTLVVQASNEKVEQLAANNLTMPHDAIASLLQRLVRHVLIQVPTLQRCRRGINIASIGLIFLLCL